MQRGDIAIIDKLVGAKPWQKVSIQKELRDLIWGRLKGVDSGKSFTLTVDVHDALSFIADAAHLADVFEGGSFAALRFGRCQAGDREDAQKEDAAQHFYSQKEPLKYRSSI